MARAGRAVAKRQPKTVTTQPIKAKTAVVVIHGIGEQTPLETLRGFVETVYQRDRSLPSLPLGPTGMLDISVVPDDVTGSAELRRITTLNDGPQKRTDFFEFYWADIMDGTPVDMVTGWIRTLVLRSPWRLPEATKVRWAWLILAIIFVICTGAGLMSAGYGVAQLTDGRAADPAEAAYLNCIRGWVVALVVAGGILWFVVNSIRSRFKMKRVSLVWPLRITVAGLALWAIPSTLLGSLPFWAAAVAMLSGWALHAVITPFAGDVARYVRATPSTVERRRLVRERGLGLLEALHKKRLDGSSVEDFTQAVGNPALYDRVVLVGHSLGTIIAYDILQLFWEKYGPTHHQKWDYEDADIQTALHECEAFVQGAWGVNARPFDGKRYEAVQAELLKQFGKARPGWRISDLITLGSPLAHADFLLADSKDEVEAGCRERRFATSPPHPDAPGGSMLYLAPGADARTSAGEPARVPHFAAQFSTVRWTNIYDEDANPLIGDLISGSLTDNFGKGIAEHRVMISAPGRPGFLRRLFTHTQYWAWHDSYEPDPADAKADDVELPDEERRALLWRNVPEHIRQLRLALRLGS